MYIGISNRYSDYRPLNSPTKIAWVIWNWHNYSIFGSGVAIMTFYFSPYLYTKSWIFTRKASYNKSII